MIEKILNKVNELSALEIQFRLSHRTIVKVKTEWIELDSDELGLSEWEDLKDLCLQNTEKLNLETKGFVRGLFKTQQTTWHFSFTEHKDTLKAYFSVIPQFNLAQSIQNPLFWDCIKKPSGLFLITGERGQGKSTLLKDILSEIRKDSPKLVAVHGHFSSLTILNHDSVIHLSEEAMSWDTGHPMYDGIDLFVVDFNSIKNWEKWIKFCEEGRTVYISISGLSVTNCLEQISSQLGQQTSLSKRFHQVLNCVCYQKVVGLKEGAVHEFLVTSPAVKEKLIHSNDLTDFKPSFGTSISGSLSEEQKKHYQSLNQSIVQALIKRRIDVKTAFKMSNDPDDLDQILKRMGL